MSTTAKSITDEIRIATRQNIEDDTFDCYISNMPKDSSFYHEEFFQTVGQIVDRGDVADIFIEHIPSGSARGLTLARLIDQLREEEYGKARKADLLREALL